MVVIWRPAAWAASSKHEFIGQPSIQNRAAAAVSRIAAVLHAEIALATQNLWQQIARRDCPPDRNPVDSHMQ